MTEQAVDNSNYEAHRALVNDLHAAIDTGNQEAAAHCLSVAEYYLDGGSIDVQQRADIYTDYNAAFPDEVITPTSVETQAVETQAVKDAAE